MNIGDLVRLRKSHPSVQRWRRDYRRNGHLLIGKWAEEGVPLILLEEYDYTVDRWRVLGPDGRLASFDDYLLTTKGMK